MTVIDLISSFAPMLLISSLAFGQSVGVKADRRRLTSRNEELCNEFDYSVDDLADCIPFYDLYFWNEAFLKSLCDDPEDKTDKQTTAQLCSDSESDENYLSLQLAILNTMYGTAEIQPDNCAFQCMYAPLNIEGISARGFKWSELGGCWQVLTGASNNLCYQSENGLREWEYSVDKSRTWCPGRVCTAYGDPHIYTFYGNSMDMERDIGDYALFSSSTLRIDIRTRVYIGPNGQEWSSVSGVYATVIEVMGGSCDIKFEIYNKYQTKSGDEEFLFNGETVEWDDLDDRFSSCDEICPNKYDIDEDNKRISIIFADHVVVSIRNLDSMQGLFVTVPFETLANDEILVSEEQLCKETYRKRDCVNDTTFFTRYDYNSETDDYGICNETKSPPTPGPISSITCDPNIEQMAEDVCGNCNYTDANGVDCQITRNTVSCVFDICNMPAVMDEWNNNNRDNAITEAQKVADLFCEQNEEFPDYLCDDTARPTKTPVPYPTRSPTRIPTQMPSPEPTRSPSPSPTEAPSPLPTKQPTPRPTPNPTDIPTLQPTPRPTPNPTDLPTPQPTHQPTLNPTELPTNIPTPIPTENPTHFPTNVPTGFPSRSPSRQPTWSPTATQHCAYMAHEFQTCFLTSTSDYVTIEDFDESESSESGVQYCAEKCFREGSSWFHYAYNSCRCIIGRCKAPLLDNVIASVYKILPCPVKCAYISSEEWWGQSPTSTELVNGVISPKPVKGLRFTSEIYATIHMLGLEMVLSNDNTLVDRTLLIQPVLYLAGENTTLVIGEPEIPAFIDGYDGKFGSMAKVFLSGNIYKAVPYTIAFEFVSGEAELMVSMNTHYYHDGEIAEDVFGVKGTSGDEPILVDTNAPHVVVCYVDVNCTVRNPILVDDEIIARCPEGFGNTEKTNTYATSCRGLDFVQTLIQQALANEFYEECTSDCLFDTNWPLFLSWKWDVENTCWNTLLLDDLCVVEHPEFAQEVFERADGFCIEDEVRTGVPTVFPTHEECNQTMIDDGSHILMSIDSAYDILNEICSIIGTANIALLDGGYIYGSNCTAVKTDESRDYTLMYCALAEGYCDFEDLLLSPNFDYDVDASLVLVQLTYLLEGKWGIDNWGFNITMRKSLKLNAVGVYMNGLAFTDTLIFYVEADSGETLSENYLPNGKNSVARWYFAVLEDQLDYERSYNLLWNFPVPVGAASAFYIKTKIRVYQDVNMPFEIEDGFTINSFITGERNIGDFPGTYTSFTTPDYIPFVNAKFCRNLPTPAPTILPTSYPTVAPTDECKHIRVMLVTFDDSLYNLPTWFDIFGGVYEHYGDLVNDRYIFNHTEHSSITLFHTGSEWKIYDSSSEYYFVLTTSGSAYEYYPILDQDTVWQYDNNQPGWDPLSEEVQLYLTCDSTLAPTVTPTAPTSTPTPEGACEELLVETEEDAPAFRFNGVYLIVKYVSQNISHYELRDGKNQWYKNGNRNEGHLFFMNDGSPMFQDVWLIQSKAGYLLIKDTVYNSIEPVDSDRWDVYTEGEIESNYDTSVNVLCITKPPTDSPSPNPTRSPSDSPTRSPSTSPTRIPTKSPTLSPTDAPTRSPTIVPTLSPSGSPTDSPSKHPTSDPTPQPSSDPPCEGFTLISNEFDEFDGGYELQRRGPKRDIVTRNGAPTWEHIEKGYIIYYIDYGLFSNRWTIQAVEETKPFVSKQDYYLLSPEIGEVRGDDLNNPPRAAEWQVFSANTWHIIGDFLMTVELLCENTTFPTPSPTVSPTALPTVDYPCIYLNYTDFKDSSSSWIGVYTKIYDPQYKNEKTHWSGPIGNELYWMEEGIFGQRWILVNTNGTVLAYEDDQDSHILPDKVLWQSIGFDSCLGHCVEFGDDVNITITYLTTCSPTSVPTQSPTRSPTRSPTDLPTTIPTTLPSPTPSTMPSVVPTPSPSKSPSTPVPTQNPSLMPSPSPTALPSTTTPEPTEHPTYAPTESPTVYPTKVCECILVSTPEDEITRLFTMLSDRNGRFHWEDGETGWSLYWVEGDLVDGRWVFQGDNHEYYYAIPGREGDVMPPLNNSWQRFTTVGYNVGSDDFVLVSIVCVPCEDTSSPTESPSQSPTEDPTPSPTCYDDFISVESTGGEDFEGVYERQGQNKNGKHYYINSNGYSLYYIHDGLFENHWVIQSPDNEYFYIITQTWEGDEPQIGDEMQYMEYRGASFAPAGSKLITIYCAESSEPTFVPTPVPSPLPTSAPTRSPSPSPTIYPTILPSAMPSFNPSPAPSLIPSSIPTPSPTAIPTTRLPTLSPSIMPSPSPTDYPTTLTPTVESVNPTLSPTVSPTGFPSHWCRCILVNSTSFNGIYMQNGRTRNQHYVWEDEEEREIYWENEGIFDVVSWVLQGDEGLIAAYEEISPNWMNTPPLDDPYAWNTYSGGSSSVGEQWITMTCTTCKPTASPTAIPSRMPSLMPSPSPTALPTTPAPTTSPSFMPSPSPTLLPSTSIPTPSPSLMPSPSPSTRPSVIPTPSPSLLPTIQEPSVSPSLMPSPSPSLMPSTMPTPTPTKLPTTSLPTALPSLVPSPSPTSMPSLLPSPAPSHMPSSLPTPSPSMVPTTRIPTSNPSEMPSPSPTYSPTTRIPSSSPSFMPSPSPTQIPSQMPTPSPTALPIVPTLMPSPMPTAYPTIWCPCITVSSDDDPTQVSGFTGTYEASGHVVNMHYKWSSHHGSEIFWGEHAVYAATGDHWVIRDLQNNVAVFQNVGRYTNTPPMGESSWGNFTFMISCNTCDPTPSPTRNPTEFPTTPLPSPSPSLMPSPAPSSMPSILPSPSPTNLPTTRQPSTSPSLMPSPSPSQVPSTPIPSQSPSLMPSPSPSSVPSILPTPSPTKLPTTSNPSSSPSLLPSPSPTALPTTPIPSGSPSVMPSPSPSAAPSTLPTPSPTGLPTTSDPTLSPSLMPSPGPTKLPTTRIPSASPSIMPSPSPTTLPSVVPTPAPTKLPTTLDPTPLSAQPTLMPSPTPTAMPTTPIPTFSPSLMPSPSPSAMPSSAPTPGPTKLPTTPIPSSSPSTMPSPSPSLTPSILPTPAPSKLPTTPVPSQSPSLMPSPSPTKLPTTRIPSSSPSLMPSPSPSSMPSTMPTPSPTDLPTTSIPSSSPSFMPSPSPSQMPSSIPTPAPTKLPTTPTPSASPSLMPSPSPSNMPTTPLPSSSPSSMPSPSPTSMPSTLPTGSPTKLPTSRSPSSSPSLMPSPSPTLMPTTPKPSTSPSLMPSPSPSQKPSAVPTPAPTMLPTTIPTESPTPWGNEFCECIEVQDKYGNSSGVYKATGDQQNSRWVWKHANRNRIYWETFGRFNDTWMMEIDGVVRTYEEKTKEWVLSPPLGTNLWGIRYVYSSADAAEFTLICVECPDTGAPTEVPSRRPSVMPSPSPSSHPSTLPTPSPTGMPITPQPTGAPSLMPTPSPSQLPVVPTAMPSPSPTALPTTSLPSSAPSIMPSPTPTRLPTTKTPTLSPSLMPSPSPSSQPSSIPTASPTKMPTTPVPTFSPSLMPSPSPTKLPTTPIPSSSPSVMPSPSPTSLPSIIPTSSPTQLPTTETPTSPPTFMPSPSPTSMPSTLPSPSPTKLPTTPTPTAETMQPTLMPSPSPSSMPSTVPSPSPTDYPTMWCNCITVNSSMASGFSGTYAASGHVINQHYHWETSDEREIYWTEEGSWAITGHGGILSVYDDDSREFVNIPPTGVSLWSVYAYGSVNYLDQWIALTCDTCEPTISPSVSPTAFPTTPIPTSSPSNMPSPSPSQTPSIIPTASPTKLPTTSIPSTSPSVMPSPSPTLMPVMPTAMPSPSPTAMPLTRIPTSSPSLLPSPSPTFVPTTLVPTSYPSLLPSPSPSQIPSVIPTPAPTSLPITPLPTSAPSMMPSPSPTDLPTTPLPTVSPSLMPSPSPSSRPSVLPTPSPSKLPTTSIPSSSPSLMPSPQPSSTPSSLPTPSPSAIPTTPVPSFSPSLMPSPSPSLTPSVVPTLSPTDYPTVTLSPTSMPSPSPTTLPSPKPTFSPTYEFPCIHISSAQNGELNGTYTELANSIGGKLAWAYSNIDLFFSEHGIFENSWTIHNKLTDDYFVLITTDSYQGDSFPPLGSISSWQSFSNGAVVPSAGYIQVFIDYQTTCTPSQVPTRAPSKSPTLTPTEIYLCVIVTWNLDDLSNSAIPEAFYGSYYYNDLNFLSNNEFSKFPIHPSTSNDKLVFTKKRNDNTISFFHESDDPVEVSTWVIDSQNHAKQLISSDPNHGAAYPRFTDFPQGVSDTPPAEYIWTLYENGVNSTDHIIKIEQSRELYTCESFDTDTPTIYPTAFPTRSPTPRPSVMPSPVPTVVPSILPTPSPSSLPSLMPSPSPTFGPTSQLPTAAPTPFPTQYPTLSYECIRITAVNTSYSYYNGLYSVQTKSRNARAMYRDGNTGFDLYYVPSAVVINHAWVIEGSQNDYLSIYDVEDNTWSQYGQADEVPPFGTFTWKQFASPPVPSRYEDIELILEPIEHCEPTQGPTERPTEYPTTSTPAPTTPSPTVVPTPSPSATPSIPPTNTPTANPTEVCLILTVSTPNEPGGTSIFEGNYVKQSVWKNDNAVWYNSHNGYYIYFVEDSWLPSSWVFQGDDGMDVLAVFDDGTDGHPNTVEDYGAEEWVLFYWGHNLQKRNETMVVEMICVPTFPPTSLPTPGPTPLPTLPPTPLPTTMPSLNPSPSPTSTPSTIPTPIPSSMPSLQPSPSPTLSPTYITNIPTVVPSPKPTFHPTHVCPCIYVSSINLTEFDGMYQLSDPFNDHEKWVNLDNSAQIYWSNDAAYEKYWIIAIGEDFALVDEQAERYAYNPPIGQNTWRIFADGDQFPSGGVDSTLTLDCSTCTPTPSPTLIPTNLITPSPTTPSPTIVPTPSPTALPSTIPTPSPTLLPTTLDPTPLSSEPTLMPSPSPTALPTTSLPSLSPSLMPSPRPSQMPTALPSPSPTMSPIEPTLMPSPSPTDSPNTPIPTASPSLMPSPAPSASPSTIPTPSPTKLPTTSLPTLSPSLMPSPSPTSRPSTLPSPSPTQSPTAMPSLRPTVIPTVTCPCLVVEDLDGGLMGYVGVYRYQGNNSPNTYKWMWERAGYNTDELIYYSNFGSGASRWVIKGSTYGEWAETSAEDSQQTPPSSTTWLINDNGGNFYQRLSVDCTQCEVTPAPTPDPTESPTSVPTSFAPTAVPTTMPTHHCEVLNITDYTNGYYTGYFEMQVLMYNGKHKWTDPATGESLYWVDAAMFESEGPVNNIWMIGYEEDMGEDDSHFLIYKSDYSSVYPHIFEVDNWAEYTFNARTNQNSSIFINCRDTEKPTKSPTTYPTEPLCTTLTVHTCCDGVYTDLDGVYTAVAHRGGKDMYYDSNNGYSIFYTNDISGSYWSIRNEQDTDLIYVENVEDNGAHPAWDTLWDLENHVLTDLEVMVSINCSDTFSPSLIPTYIPTDAPTADPTTLDPSPMPTLEPTYEPTKSPTEAPSEFCHALYVEDEDGEITKFDGEYSRLSETKNGKAQWMNFITGGDIYWIDRGVWANTWIIRAADYDYLMSHVVDTGSLHPPLDAEWASLGDDILWGEHYQNLKIQCTTQPPAPSPTSSPTLTPTCEGNSIHIEDQCNSEYSGYYNFDYVHDDRNAYVHVDGTYEVIYIAEDIFAGKWMIRPFDAESCEEFFIIGGYTDRLTPPENALWESYACGCTSLDLQAECNFKITCMHTKAPIPTEQPSNSPTPAPVQTQLPSPAPTHKPSPVPTRSPTRDPTKAPTVNPTSQPTTGMPTQSPVTYDCNTVELQPCSSTTVRDVTFYERTDNKTQVTSSYYETKLYTEQKGYTFVASQDMIMYEAGMSFVNLASYQSITVRVFDDSSLLYESDYSYDGNGFTKTTGSPRGDYYTFRNINVQLVNGQQYTVVFVVHCPATKTSRAEYPLCAPHYEVYSIADFGTSIVNVYQYGEDNEIPTESDLYAPFISICYTLGMAE